jgi:arylsulfatase A-like enzyme
MMRVQDQSWIPDAPFLPTMLAALGYRSHAVMTHPRPLAVQGLREAFDEIDVSLSQQAMSAGGITSELVTDRVLAHVDAHDFARHALLLWAHYYDPHAPYVERPGSSLTLSSIDGYVAEIRRTDRAIGRLISTLAPKVPSGYFVVFITADHGEELGEHGASRHGSNLYETTTRVPFVAWRNGDDATRGLHDDLPRNHDEFAAYVASTVTGQSFASRRRSLLWSPNAGDPQLGVVSNGWKLIYHQKLAFYELYDLESDPDEKTDHAADAPSRVQALGRILGQEYAVRAGHADE